MSLGDNCNAHTLQYPVVYWVANVLVKNKQTSQNNQGRGGGWMKIEQKLADHLYCPSIHILMQSNRARTSNA